MSIMNKKLQNTLSITLLVVFFLFSLVLPSFSESFLQLSNKEKRIKLIEQKLNSVVSDFFNKASSSYFGITIDNFFKNPKNEKNMLDTIKLKYKKDGKVLTKKELKSEYTKKILYHIFKPLSCKINKIVSNNCTKKEIEAIMTKITNINLLKNDVSIGKTIGISLISTITLVAGTAAYVSLYTIPNMSVIAYAAAAVSAWWVGGAVGTTVLVETLCGPVGWAIAGVTVAGAAGYFYYSYKKNAEIRKKAIEELKTVVANQEAQMKTLTLEILQSMEIIGEQPHSSSPLRKNIRQKRRIEKVFKDKNLYRVFKLTL